jgi:LAS superfamily LD-carboxypeptidase LdcB
VVDFAPSNWNFAGTPAYSWLQENANGFGFFETLPQYPQIKTPWEAWHWCYLGLEE